MKLKEMIKRIRDAMERIEGEKEGKEEKMGKVK